MGNNPHKRSAIASAGVILLVCLYNSLTFSQSIWRTNGALPDVGEDYNSIAYGNGRYVATGQFGTIVASPDSIDWFGRAADIPDILLWSVSFGNGLFITAGSDKIFTSADGVSWSARTVETGDFLIAATRGNGASVAVGTRGSIFISTNGKEWADRSPENESADFYSVCYGNGLFVAVNIDATGDQKSSFYFSTDGLSWSKTEKLSSTLWQVTFGDGLFVAVGDSGAIMTSTDGARWTRQLTETANRLLSVAFGKNCFIAAGEAGTVLSSPDGYRWTDRSPGSEKDLYAVTYGTDQFVIIGDRGTLFTAAVDEATANRRNGESLTNANIINFNFGGTAVRFPLGSGFTGSDLDIGLFTVAGKRLYAEHLKRTDLGMNASAPRIAPGTYVLTLVCGGKRMSMPVTVAR